ncbi:hypothetical protein K9M79_02420 [Candidatus Woesearchaeota archaeon]|nr:hypothetical protein [Candidatus Woesearchaeota archaeon]
MVKIIEDFIYAGSDKLIEEAVKKQIGRLHILSDKKQVATETQEFAQHIELKFGTIGKDYYDASGKQNPKDFTKALRKAKYVFNLELTWGRDTFKTNFSLLDEATCKVCREVGVTIVFNLNNLVQDTKTSNILSRMIQNYEYVRRYKLLFCVGSFASNPAELRNPKDIGAFIRHFFR